VADLKELDTYSYCGHCAVIGKKIRQWQELEYVLSYFGKRIGESSKEVPIIC